MRGDVIFAHTRGQPFKPCELAELPPLQAREARVHAQWWHQRVHENPLAMLDSLPGSIFDCVRGTTDSELVFALFLSQFPPEDVDGPATIPHVGHKKFCTINISHGSNDAGIETPFSKSWVAEEHRHVPP